MFYAGLTVSWRFDCDELAEKVAILVTDAVEKSFGVEFFNTTDESVTVEMTGWDVLGGEWNVSSWVQENVKFNRKEAFGRNETITLTVPPGGSFLSMSLSGRGETVTNRPDLAIGNESVRRQADRLVVTVHNLGAWPSEATELALVDESGNVIGRSAVPALEGTADLLPKTAEVSLPIPMDINLNRFSVVIDPDNKQKEIDRRNNRVELKNAGL